MGEIVKPRRRIVAKIEIEADDWRELGGALRCLSTDIAVEGSLSNRVSGGYSSGYVVTCSEDTTITHDSWLEGLNAYLAKLDGGSPHA